MPEIQREKQKLVLLVAKSWLSLTFSQWKQTHGQAPLHQDIEAFAMVYPIVIHAEGMEGWKGEQILQSSTCRGWVYSFWRHKESEATKLITESGGFPDGTSDKEPACQCRRCKRLRFNAWVGKILWRRAWLLTPVFLSGESHGQRSLVGYSLRGYKESDTTEWLSTHTCASVRGLVTLGFGCGLLHFLEVPGKRGTRRQKKEWLLNQRVLTGAETCVHGRRDDWLRSARSDRWSLSASLVLLCSSASVLPWCLKLTAQSQVLWRREDAVENIRRGLNKSR